METLDKKSDNIRWKYMNQEEYRDETDVCFVEIATPYLPVAKKSLPPLESFLMFRGKIDLKCKN